MKLNFTFVAVLGWGQFAPSGTLIHLKPWPLYNSVATGFSNSQCNAIERQPQLLARDSAFAISILAIPFRRNFSRTATFDMYAIPALQQRNNSFCSHQKRFTKIKREALQLLSVMPTFNARFKRFQEYGIT